MKFNPDIVIIETIPGVGGIEAKFWAKDLLLSYLKYAQRKGFSFAYIDENMVQIKGPSAFNLFKNETGVHRVQRIPTTEKRGRIHTSTALIVVLPQIIEKEIKVNPENLEWQFFRSSGSGGQNVNKVSTAVRLTHKPSGIVIKSSKERHQEANRRTALQILASKLYQLEQEKKKGFIYSYVKNAGKGERAEKIRTYNFPQNRITDHRVRKSYHNLEQVINQGRWDKILVV